MNYNIVAGTIFIKELKHLAKKFPSIKNDVAMLAEKLLQEPMSGTPIGNNCYKVRMAITSKGKGKSGGARLITHIKVTEDSLYLLSIYDKSELDNIAEDEILRRIKNII